MSHTIDLTEHGLLALSRTSLATLRAGLLRDMGPEAAIALQEAGYAGGESVYASFTRWLAARTEIPPEELDVDVFQEYAAEFFRATGWGTLAIDALHDTVATIDSEDWGEGDPASALDAPGCHMTTGMFADFFGRVASAPLAVLEVECRSAGAPRCRFLIGGVEVMERLYEELAEGVGYEEAVERI